MVRFTCGRLLRPGVALLMLVGLLVLATNVGASSTGGVSGATVDQASLSAYCNPAVHTSGNNDASLSNSGPSVSFTGSNVFGYADASSLKASATASTGDSCGMALSTGQGVTVGAGTSGLNPGDPVTLSVHLTLDGTINTSGSGSFDEIATASAAYDIAQDGLMCGTGESRRPCPVLDFRFDLNQQDYDVSPGTEVDRWGGWSISSNDPNYNAPSGDDYLATSCMEACSGSFTVNVDAGTATFVTQVGAHLSLGSSLSTYGYSDVNGSATADFAHTFGVGVVTPVTKGVTVAYDGATSADTTAPTTTATTTPAANAAGWNKGPVTVTLTATDPDGAADVASTTYTLDGGAATTYTAPFTVSGDGTHHLTYSSVDKAGNKENPARVLDLKIDSVAPTTTARPDRAANASGWYTAPVTVTLSSTDNLSGVVKTTYSIDGAAPQVYSGPFTVSGDGSHAVSYSSTDTAGNVEDAKTLTLKIDATAPKISAVATPASVWPPNHKLVDVSVAVSVSDSLSGADGFVLVSATASGDPGDIQGFVVGRASTSGKVTANKDEVYTLTYKGKDKAGNSATVVVTIAVPHDQGN